jgi:hypothetical protein
LYPSNNENKDEIDNPAILCRGYTASKSALKYPRIPENSHSRILSIRSMNS